MSGSVQLRLGDIFDGPSDMIILPCSTGGTVTQFVQQKLWHYHIPSPNPGMGLGDVQIMPFTGGENIAQFVAYAVSVERQSSTPEAINRIGVQLGKYTQENSTVRLIAAPLLGAGAGGLHSEVVVQSLRDGFMSTASPNATLIINVLHENVFNRLSYYFDQLYKNISSSTQPVQVSQKSLRVFISYTKTSPQHEQWVEDLGKFLRQNGIDARLDVWHLRRGMDLPQFMTNELTLADRVILISNEEYAKRADGRLGGVGWETMIIQGDLAGLPPDSVKYIVIVRSDNVDEGLPKYLKTKFVIHWPSSSMNDLQKQLLLKELFDFIDIPPIGKPPVFI